MKEKSAEIKNLEDPEDLAEQIKELNQMVKRNKNGKCLHFILSVEARYNDLC